MAKDAPVGFAKIRLTCAIDTDSDEAQVTKLLQLTERYCVVAPTLGKGIVEITR